ncbi:hypothetical protein BLNAU_14129 [Blattamonas nauphoetae]|uniref:Cyclin N-terminal domain-containing protein n=1 Tax=Blattamonas nauphoetae TaxID=2049346 RepID=A0ABQ9XHN0_9EUKA|nr:hypothetical protein BLNAU_14129 [Blattamonas nauphoetae]
MMAANPHSHTNRPLSNPIPLSLSFNSQPEPNQVTPSQNTFHKLPQDIIDEPDTKRSYVPSCHFTASYTLTLPKLQIISRHVEKSIIHTLISQGTLESSSKQGLVDADTRTTMLSSINWIFTTSIKHARMTDQEVVSTVALVEKFLSASAQQFLSCPPNPDEDEQDSGKSHLNRFQLTEHNYGTVLVCAALLTIKYLRDKPFANTAWAKLFKIDLSVIHYSEQVLCNLVGFDLSIPIPVLEHHFARFIKHTSSD